MHGTKPLPGNRRDPQLTVMTERQIGPLRRARLLDRPGPENGDVVGTRVPHHPKRSTRQAGWMTPAEIPASAWFPAGSCHHFITRAGTQNPNRRRPISAPRGGRWRGAAR